MPAMPQSPTVRALLAAGAMAWIGIAALALALGHPVATVLPLALGLLLVLGAVVLAAAFHDARRAQESRQLEAYVALVGALRPEVPLPATRGWAASPDFLKMVAELVLDRRPRLVVEASSGTSTVVIALCLRKLGAGHVVSLEHDARFAQQTRRALAQQGLGDFATVVHAPLKRHLVDGRAHAWYDLDAMPMADLPIDLLVVDGPPGSVQANARFPAVPLLLQRLAPDAAVVMDDAARRDERAIVAEWVRLYKLQSRYLPLEKGACVLSRNHAAN